MAKNTDSPKPGMTAFLSFLLIAGMILIGLFVPGQLGLALMIIVLLLFLVLIGFNTTHMALGVLINERKIMSLSRLQVVLWTILVMSAFLFVGLQRIHDPITRDPLSFNIDWRIWTLLGISAASFVGSGLSSSSKKTKQPVDPEAVNRTAIAVHEPKEVVEKNRDGILYVNENASDAKFLDIVQGDELDNTAVVDLSKVQMLLFTVVSVAAYSAALFRWVGECVPSDLLNFPELSDGMIAILGISHVGFLGTKAIDQTKGR